MRIFVSYRRADSHHATGRLADRLAVRFGPENVFVDVASTRIGTDFRRIVERELARCDVLLVVIGPGGLDAVDDRGARRLDDPGDLVRSEVAGGLARGIPVVPVLIDDAVLPTADQLPSELAGLAYRQAERISYATFVSDASRLIAALQALPGPPRDEIRVGAADVVAAAVRPNPRAVTRGVVLDTAGFVLDRAARPPRVHLTGRLTGEPPAGSSLWVVGYPDPQTFDSLGNPGSGRYYPNAEIRPDPDGSWRTRPLSIGYDEAIGITTIQLLVRVEDAVRAEFDNRALHPDGIAAERFEELGVDVIASFEVPTAP